MKFLEHFKTKVFSAETPATFTLEEINDWLAGLPADMCVHEIIHELKGAAPIVAPASPVAATETQSVTETTTQAVEPVTEAPTAPVPLSVADVVPSNTAGEPVLHEETAPQ